MYATAVRISDGVLGWVDESPNPINETAIIQSAVNMLGGISTDYVYQEFTEAQALAIRAAMPARSKLVEEVLSHATPITASLSAGTVEADGVAEITLSIDVHDAAYNGAVKVVVTATDGSVTTETLTAVAGVASDVISTALVGVHQITVETILHGLAFTSFEGV